MNTREPTGLPLRRQRENVKSQHHASTFTSSCPAKRGRGTTLRSRVVEGASASKLALPPHAPSTMLRHSRRFAAACLISKNGGQRPPMPPPPHFVRGRINEIVLATLSCARALRTTTTPKINSLPAIKGKRSAERRMPSMSALRKQVYAVAPLICYAAARPESPPSPACGGGSGRGHARLSALTLAALATGYHPDGSAPEPGFPKTDLAGVLPARPSCLRLSTLRADRSFCRSTGDPEPPGSGLAIPRAGTAPRFRLSGLPFRKGALPMSEVAGV